MYVITGATGNTGKRIAENLLAAGKSVKVIGRSAERLAALVEKGAVPATGDLADANFLAEAFQGATAVYLLIPPKWDVSDWRAYQRTLIDAYVQALKASGVKKAVLLSSQGAHLLEGAGPISGLGEFEQAVRQVPGLDSLSLRAGFFMENLYANIGLIKQAGIFGYTLQPDFKLTVVHTRDIAEVATRRLLALDFSGHQHEFVAGPADVPMTEIAGILGAAIGKSDLAYVSFERDAARAGMLQAGLPEPIVDGYLEMFDAMRFLDFQAGFARTSGAATPTSLEWFAENEFKYAFAAN